MLRNFGTQDGELYKPDTMEMGGGNSSSKSSSSSKSMPNMNRSDIDLSQFAGKTPPDNSGDSDSGFSFDPGSMPDMGDFDPGNMPDMGDFDPNNMPAKEADPTAAVPNPKRAARPIRAVRTPTRAPRPPKRKTRLPGTTSARRAEAAPPRAAAPTSTTPTMSWTATARSGTAHSPVRTRRITAAW